MCVVSYAILTLWNSCSVGYILPSLEIFHNTTTEKKYSPIHGCCHTWGQVVRDKTKKMMQRNSCTTQPKQIFTMLLLTKTFALFLELCARLEDNPPFFRWWIRKKIFVLYLSKYSICMCRQWMYKLLLRNSVTNNLFLACACVTYHLSSLYRQRNHDVMS
jgi:hypothetical protein